MRIAGNRRQQDESDGSKFVGQCWRGQHRDLFGGSVNCGAMKNGARGVRRGCIVAGVSLSICRNMGIFIVCRGDPSCLVISEIEEVLILLARNPSLYTVVPVTHGNRFELRLLPNVLSVLFLLR